MPITKAIGITTTNSRGNDTAHNQTDVTKCWTGVAVTVLEDGELIGRDRVSAVITSAETRSG